MKKLFKLFTMLFAFMLICVSISGCNLSTANNKSLTYVSMRINPEIELVVDENGEVIIANAINEDGEVVLGEIELIGLSVEEAGELFTSMAVELGFIDVDTESATVYISTDGEDEEKIEEIEEKVKDRINHFFEEKGIFGKTEEEDLETLRALAEEWGVSLKEAKLISRILELYPEMTIEEVITLTFEKRVELIKNDSEKHGLPVELRDEYKNAIEELKVEYEELFELRRELIELQHQLEKVDLTEEQRETLQTEYDLKKTKYEELRLEYETAVKEILDQKQEKIIEVKEELKNKADIRREEFAEKINSHEEKIRNNIDDIKNQITEWRNGHANNEGR